MKKICIVGHFGGKKKFNDGQTVKTRTLYDSLKRKGIGLKIVDTYYSKKNPIRFIFSLIRNSLYCRTFIILLSTNGRKYLFPWFSFLSVCLKKKIYHYVIGSTIINDIHENTKIRNYLNNFSSNWVEGKLMKQQLIEMGVENAIFIPNYKNIKPIEEINISHFTSKYNFCTFSRVIFEKGIEDAVLSIEEICKKYPNLDIKLDIYGPIDKVYEQRFFNLINNSIHCKYKGVIAPDQSVSVLKDYYCLLFPTFWKSEGMPGTIIDSFCAGLPVIARRWILCDELITDSYNGLVYDFEKPEELKNKIEYAILNKEKIFQMKKNCLQDANKFTEDAVIKCILEELGF